MASPDAVTMPAWPAASLRGKISSSRWETAVNAFAHQLESNLTINDAKQLSKNTVYFLRGYLNDEASERLRQLDSELPPGSPAEFILRKRAFDALRRIATAPGSVDLAMLMDAAVVYEGGNHAAMVSFAEAALDTNPTLAGTLNAQMVPAFGSMLQQPNIPIALLLKFSICLVRLLGCGASITDALSTNQLILAIAKAYNSIHLSSADEEQVMQTKANLMDSFRTLLYHRTSASRHQRTKREELYELLFLLNDAAPSSSNTQPAAASSSRAVLLQAPILAVYESTYGLSETLSGMGPEDDATREYMMQTLKGLRIPGLGNTAQAPRPPAATTNGTSRTGDAKGKSKAAVTSDDGSELELKVTQVLDILPDESPERIRACLRYPKFGGSVESVVAALLEGNVPEEAMSLTEPDAKDRGQEQEAFPLLEKRRNVFDDAPLDFSKLRIGKTRDNADGLLRDRTHLDAIKADILRRVQEMSEDEDEEADAKGGKIVAFEEELDDGMEPSSAVKVTNDGEESEEGDDDEAGEPQQAKKVDVETVLEQTYIRDPKLFDRDAATRRTKQRADLRAQTGWSDEQLEGWRIMLERNPRKDRILQKHEFSGNRPLVSEDEGQSSSAPASDREGQGAGRGRGGGRGHGGGGGGRGRGGEGRGGGNPARERAWKDKNKARQGNHDRKRGHDKKMARAAGPPV
ncbi:hypothetical protein CALCODRAFT_475096 [Calocera cornea HHB12733]|uniref:CUE domain-containing protein n=1 Tax=Calocera cornea HHB12733 TaxID=1353952 RepID=A0A165DM23_9BASI|nr:hypothetical protein CALCODRAFT_475096 [Calocera cornea HHB12733]